MPFPYVHGSTVRLELHVVSELHTVPQTSCSVRSWLCTALREVL